VQIIGVPLAGTSVTKTTTLCVLRATVSKVMSAYTNHKKTSAKRNTGRKSTLTERDHCTFRIVLKNQRITAAELNIHHEDPVDTKTV
jgi:predicted HTH transcriptional regulator